MWHTKDIMAKTSEQTKVNVGPQGRIVIPAGLRRALEIEPGDTLVARLEDGRIVLEKRANILARVRRRFAGVPREVRLSDELIAERRKEAERELEG